MALTTAAQTTTASLLPLIPRVFFLYLEPVFISYGIVLILAQRLALFTLLPNVPKDAIPLPLLFLPAQSAGFLVCMMAYGLVILLASPPNRKQLMLHIAILSVADFIHWAGLLMTIAETHLKGWDGVLDTNEWDAEVWNLVLYPLGTLGIKVATLLGLFGRIGE